jgi:hypothetical protein
MFSLTDAGLNSKVIKNGSVSLLSIFFIWLLDSIRLEKLLQLHLPSLGISPRNLCSGLPVFLRSDKAFARHSAQSRTHVCLCIRDNWLLNSLFNNKTARACVCVCACACARCTLTHTHTHTHTNKYTCARALVCTCIY